MENKNVINIKNLVKQFPVGGNYFTALQNIDLKLSEGEHISSINLKKKKNIIDRLKTKVDLENISNHQELLDLNTKIENLKHFYTHIFRCYSSATTEV